MHTTHSHTNDISPNRSTRNFFPLILSAVIVLLDQVSKFIVQKTVPEYSPIDENSIISVIGDFFWIIHIYNKGALFSLGNEWSTLLSTILLRILPVILLGWLLYLILFARIDRAFRWLTAGILGGGMGNIIDRFFREKGVLDWISIKTYGLFGFERWPTFNIADSTIVVCIILWLAFTIRYEIILRKQKNSTSTSHIEK